MFLACEEGSVAFLKLSLIELGSVLYLCIVYRVRSPPLLMSTARKNCVVESCTGQMAANKKVHVLCWRICFIGVSPKARHFTGYIQGFRTTVNI